jgi:hypothetical protein
VPTYVRGQIVVEDGPLVAAESAGSEGEMGVISLARGMPARHDLRWVRGYNDMA